MGCFVDDLIVIKEQQQEGPSKAREGRGERMDGWVGGWMNE
jgi:hypothetical protein